MGNGGRPAVPRRRSHEPRGDRGMNGHEDTRLVRRLARWVRGQCWGRLGGLAIPVVLAGCAVGPRYQAPAPPAVARYTNGSPAGTQAISGPAGAAQTFEYGAKLKGLWWQLFRSPVLNDAMDRALRQNPGLRQAEATLQEARENARAANGVFYPQVTGNLQGAREKSSGAGSGGLFPGRIFSLYSGNVAVSYSPDLFGLQRLVASTERAQVDYQRFTRDAAYLTLEGNVATTLIEEASLRSQIKATHTIIDDQAQLLKLLSSQYRFGAVSSVAVLTQTQQVASNQAVLASLEEQLTVRRHALAVFLGAYPEHAGIATLSLSDLTLPQTLPVSLPSTLVRQRPDIRGAEAILRVANGTLGEAVARLYPQLTLTGTYGGESNTARNLFLPGNRIWALAAGLTAPIFEGGTLEARKRAAAAAYRGAVAGYQGTVLNAFQQVANALRALQYDAHVLAYQRQALSAANRALRLARVEYRAGAVQYLSILTTEVDAANARIAYVRARAQRYQDTVALMVALGGGWWPTHDAEATPVSAAAVTSPQAPQATSRGTTQGQ